MKYFKESFEYVPGRNNLAVTIFVPYDCPNNCPFCTSKSDYKDTSNFSLKKILKAIPKVANFDLIKDIVITGGEPFADLKQLQKILNECSKYGKNIYINTTLPVRSKEEATKIYRFICKNEQIINGLNISRHMCLKTNYEDDELIKKIYKNTIVKLRINSVLLNVTAELKRVSDFIKYYSKFVHSINFRGDYTKVKNQDDLRGLDEPILNILFNLSYLYYISSGGCLVCNNNDFITNNDVLVSYHRGYEHSLVKKGRYLILNDIIIKQDGKILSDWDGEELNLKLLNIDFCNCDKCEEK